jgi:hypothetical protein
MNEHLQNYRDKDTSLYQLDGSYTLLLQIYPDSFSYAVVHQHKLAALAINCGPDELADPGLPATGFTLVPNALFSAGHIASFAHFLDVKPAEKIFAQPLDNDNHIIYKVDETVAETAEIFGLEKTCYIAKGWIDAIANYNPSEKNLYLNIGKNQVEILYLADGKLRFYNTFEFRNPVELVYFTSFVAKELELQPQKITLLLSGDVDTDDKNASRLAEFFNRVELNTLHILDLPPHIVPHQILSLAALTLCVSSEVY